MPSAPAGDPLSLASDLLNLAAGLAADDPRRDALTEAARVLLAPAARAAIVATPIPLRRVGP